MLYSISSPFNISYYSKYLSNISSLSPYILFIKENNDYYKIIFSLEYGSGKRRKLLGNKPKQFFQTLNIITYFVFEHYKEKGNKNKYWKSFYISHQAQELRKRFGRTVWDNISKLLIKNDILEKNEKYSNSEENPFTKSYRLNKDFLDNVEFEILDLTQFQKEESEERDLSNITLKKEELLKHFDSISKKRNWRVEDQCYYKKVIHKFNCYDFSITGSTGRVYTKTNLLPKEFRSYVLIDGEETSEIDISSALPSMLYCYTKGKEAADYEKVVESGKLYELFADQYLVKHSLSNGLKDLDQKKVLEWRNRTKKAFVYYLGGYRKNDCEWIGSILKNLFPNLHAFIEKVEADHKKKCETKKLEFKGGEMSRMLQEKESKIVVKMVGGLSSIGIHCESIHDGIRVQSKHVQTAKTALEDAFKAVIGIKPSLTIEDHVEPVDSEEIDINDLYYEQQYEQIKHRFPYQAIDVEIE